MIDAVRLADASKRAWCLTQKVTRKRRATLRDVAQAAEVSVATVSRVLNAPATVSPITRERVEGAIDSLRFMRSPAARAINSGRTRAVAALVPTLDHAIFARFLGAMETRLGELGLSLLVATTGGDPEREERKAWGLVEIGAEGLIVSGVSHSTGLDRLADRHDLPIVATSFFDPASTMPTIGYDNRAVARTALDHLTALGHRRIGVIHGPLEGNDRTQARLDALKASSDRGQLSFHAGDLGVGGGCRATAAALALPDSPTALLCLSDVIALGAMFELQRAGLGIPGDMSVIGIDDLSWSKHSAPGLTSVSLPVSEMGAEAAAALASWIETQERPDHRVLSHRLVPRGSTGPPSGV